MNGTDVLILIAILILGGWWLNVRHHPIRRCPSCKGGKKNSGSNGERWGLCSRCGGKGMVRRFGAGPGPRGPSE